MMMWNIRRLSFVIFFSSLLASCSNSKTTPLAEIKVKWSDGKFHQACFPEDSSLKVFIFMAPECPVSISFTSSIAQLADTFSNSGVKFYIVFPGNFYSENENSAFLKNHDLNLPALFDTGNKIAGSLKATVTPEAYLMNREGEIIYSGAIDNRAYAPGKKRQTVTEFYLKNAITATLAGQNPDPRSTEAIGCFIEF